MRFKKPDGKATTVAIGSPYLVDPAEGLVRDIEKLFGRDVVSFRV